MKRAIMQNLFIILAAFWVSCSWSASLYPETWDDEFKDAALFLPIGTDWRLLKAQCWQESRLDPFAKSPAGAMGLCQFMPGTWAQYGKSASPWIPEASIRSAGWYMARLNRMWSSPRPADERYKLALGSYNAGAGHLIKAQTLCGGPMGYGPIVACLPLVTGRHSKETTDYVKKIWHTWWPRMVAQ